MTTLPFSGVVVSLLSRAIPWTSFAFFSSSSAMRARSFWTISGGARCAKLGLASFLFRRSRSASTFPSSLSMRFFSSPRSMRPSSGTKISKRASTNEALTLGRGPGSVTVSSASPASGSR